MEGKTREGKSRDLRKGNMVFVWNEDQGNQKEDLKKRGG